MGVHELLHYGIFWKLEIGNCELADGTMFERSDVVSHPVERTWEVR